MAVNAWDRWQMMHAEIVSSLVMTYRQLEKWAPLASVLEDWVKKNPNDTNAKQILEETRGKVTVSESEDSGTLFE